MCKDLTTYGLFTNKYEKVLRSNKGCPWENNCANRKINQERLCADHIVMWSCAELEI